MNTRTRIKTSSIIVYTILAIAFLWLALWLYAPTPLYSSMFDSKRFLSYWFFVIGSLYVFALINSLLQKLHELKRLPGILGSFYDRDLLTSARSLLAWTREKAHNLKITFLLWGSLILVSTIISSFTGILDDKELGLFHFFVLPRGLLPQSVSRTMEPMDRVIPIVQLLIFSGDNNSEKYLKACLKIVNDLKRLGAKAVLVDARSLLGRAQNIKLFKELNNMGIVVFGFSRNTNYIIGNVREGEMRFARGYYTMEDVDFWRPSLLPRFYPVVEMQGFEVERLYGRDVSLSLLGKYLGYPDTLMPTKQGGNIVFGEYTIPVMKDGSLFVFTKDSRNVPTISAHYDVYSDTLEYTMNLRKSLSLDSYQDDINGKMVFLAWAVAGGITASSFSMPWYYMKAIRNLIENSFVKKIEYLHIFISAFLLVLSGLICLSVRPFLAMQLLFVLAVFVFLAGYWVFWVYSILFNLLYSCVSVVLAMLVFPIVKAWHQARLSSYLS